MSYYSLIAMLPGPDRISDESQSSTRWAEQYYGRLNIKPIVYLTHFNGFWAINISKIRWIDI